MEEVNVTLERSHALNYFRKKSNLVPQSHDHGLVNKCVLQLNDGFNGDLNQARNENKDFYRLLLLYNSWMQFAGVYNILVTDRI